MADRRIRWCQKRKEILEKLWSDGESTGPFATKVDVLCFAASYGATNNASEKLEQPSEPIRHDIFENRGYGTLFDLLAIYRTEDPSILENSDDAEIRRATVFEEYANGGLRILEGEMKGVVDCTEQVALLVGRMRPSPSKDDTGVFNITDLI